MSTSTPIALPGHNDTQPPSTHTDGDVQMGSYIAAGTGFNPSSYNRHYLGSPMSWRPGSFGAQFVPSASPTAMLVGSFEPGKSSHDSSLINAWAVFDRQGELCRDYSCCGTQLADLHALLEHFEDVHIIIKDPSQPPVISIPFNPQINEPQLPPSLPPSSYNPGPFDTDEMDLGLEDGGATSPPPSTAPTSRAPSPTPSPTSSSRPALNIALTGVGFPGAHTPTASFSGFHHRYADAGEEANTASVAPELVYAPEDELPIEEEEQPVAVASTATLPTQLAAPVPKPSKKRNSSNPSSAVPSRVPTPTSVPLSSNVGATTAVLNSATMLLPHKPFRCPKPNCSKSYKQANGLKYHMTHGSCSFAPAKDVEAVRALLERKRAAAAAASANTSEDEPATPAPTSGSSELSPAELNEVEARMRPYACGVGDCSRRYKNMNGLRYHYQHSGDHGAVGLGLLAGGLHGCLALKGNGSSGSGNSTPTTPTGTTNTTSYAWGSTLLPHIQAVASTTSSSTPSTSRPTTPPKPKPTPAASSPAKKSKKTSKAGAEPSFSVNSGATFSVKPTPAAVPRTQAQAQYQNYQQWYAGGAGSGSATNVGGQQMQMQMQVDVGMR
uniref:C2H2-type domain-containing protein n=1 Tax=Mycena chlorophos TaxID=658473 RepID=A0ABQ0LSN5_MYCCL|nr:predicted protein [Mycena chlorophos]